MINAFLLSRFVLKDIKNYFGFLFEKGFNIHHAEYATQCNGSWSVQLKSRDCLIYIVQDRGCIEISFAPLPEIQPYKNPIDLEQMIFVVTEGKVCIGNFEGNLLWRKKQQFERSAGLLREYVDQISLFFACS